jgi:hypothetical protein
VIITGDGKVIGLQRTGVIIGLPSDTELDAIADVRQGLEVTFPGVTFAFVGGATGMVSFTYTTTSDESGE